MLNGFPKDSWVAINELQVVKNTNCGGISVGVYTYYAIEFMDCIVEESQSAERVEVQKSNWLPAIFSLKAEIVIFKNKVQTELSKEAFSDELGNF